MTDSAILRRELANRRDVLLAELRAVIACCEAGDADAAQGHARQAQLLALSVCEKAARLGGLLPEVRPTDALWRDVAADARASLEARYIRAQELIRLLGYAHHNRLLAWRKRHGFPDPALDLGERSGGHVYERHAVAAWLDAHPGYATAAARAAVAGERQHERRAA